MDNIYKGYRIELSGDFPVYVVRAIAQGRIPKPLTGCYTSVTEAKKAIDAVPPKVVKKKALKDG